jgi:hypothetical protein
MSRNRCVKNKNKIKTKVKHVEKESNEEIGTEISKVIVLLLIQQFII